MTNNEMALKLKAAAEKATPGEWIAFIGGAGTCAVHTADDDRCGDIVAWPGFDGQKKAKPNAQFIATANPANIIALLAERDADKKRIAELEREKEAMTAVALAMRDDMRDARSLLEARTVIVKLPSKHNNSGFVTDGVYNKGIDDCYLAFMEACAAAGINLEVGQ